MSPLRISRRLRRIFIGLLITVVLFALVGFFVLPPVVKSQLEKRLSAASGRVVTVEKVRLNPFALSLTLENFAVKEKSGSETFVGWTKLYINFELLASLGHAWVIGEVALDGFHADVAMNRDGSFNFSDLLALAGKNSREAPSSKPARAIRVKHLAVAGAKMAFADQSRAQPFKTTVGPLTFSVSEFTTVPQQNAPYGFAAVTEAGETLSWKGVLSADPVSSSGELRIENVVLSKYAPYYSDFLKGDIVDGKVSVHGRYELNLGQTPNVLRLNDGGMVLQNLKIRERGQTDSLIEVAEMKVAGVNADATSMKASVASVQLNGGNLAARRERDGSINFESVFVVPGVGSPTPKAATIAPATPPPDVNVAEFSLKDFQINVSDLAGANPAQLGLRHLQVAMKNLTLAKNSPIPLEVAFDWLPRGTVKLEGTVSADPMRAKLQTSVAGFDLLPLSSYLEQFVNVRLTQGNFSAALAADLAFVSGQPTGTIAGEWSLDKFSLVDLQNQELAGVGALAVKGIKLEVAPQIRASVEEIALQAPYARVLMNQAGTLNVATIVKQPGVALQPSELPGADSSLPRAMPSITIGKVSIEKGDFSYADRSIEPSVRTAVQDFAGTISGLSSENMARAQVNLKAMVDGTGPVSITGKLDPLGARKFVDLAVTVRNVDLQPLSPYSGRFAGYELARGKLVLDVKASLDDKKVSANNVITLNQFTFGAATPSPTATGLPVRLGVALLKDLDGKIVIDVPVEGSLDDPNFRIGKVVLRVIVNLLTKAAVSPFSLVGSMFGGGGDELAFQEFSPGTAELQPAEIKKLETMVKALTNRPALNLDFEGSFDRAADGYALKRKKFAEQVRRSIWEEKHATDPNIATPESLVISAEENAAEVKKLFDKKFPPGTEFGTPLPPQPAVVSPPAPPAGMFKRLIGKITFKTAREKRAVEAENQRRVATHDQQVKTVLAEGLPLDQMIGRLAEATDVTDEDYRGLAQQRAQRVRNYFVETGKIAPDRLFLAQNQSNAAKMDRGPRVFLNLQ